MKVLFVNANLYGHINPTLGLVRALTQRGNMVTYFCSETFSEPVKKMGADWIGYSNKIIAFLQSYRPTDRHPFFMLMEYMLLYDEVVLPEIMDILEKNQYDVIICDSYFGGACFLKQMTDLPVICSHSSFAMSHTPVPDRMLVPGFHPQLDNCYAVVKRICERYQIQEPTMEQIFTSKGELNIVYTTKAFNGNSELETSKYLFNGPSLDRLQEESDIDFSVIGDRKVIYIALGSINTDFLEFYKTCMQAFCKTDYYVFLSIGKKCDIKLLGSIPDNFLVRSFLPQLQILEKSDAFITHAGFNSVNESLYFGVPMLAFPQVNDQRMVAARLVAMQLGMKDSMEELTPDKLLVDIEALLQDSTIKEKCLAMSQDMKKASGIEETAIQLARYVAEK